MSRRSTRPSHPRRSPAAGTETRTWHCWTADGGLIDPSALAPGVLAELPLERAPIEPRGPIRLGWRLLIDWLLSAGRALRVAAARQPGRQRAHRYPGCVHHAGQDRMVRERW